MKTELPETRGEQEAEGRRLPVRGKSGVSLAGELELKSESESELAAQSVVPAAAQRAPIVSSEEMGRQSKAELLLANEELSKANQQLQSKVAELESSHADIRNLLTSSEIATICLDRDYRIKWFTPGASVTCDMMSTDIGRNIGIFSSARLGEALIDDIDSVLETRAPKLRELNLFKSPGYLRRILPYRTEDGQVSGVVITYTDITEARKSAEATAAALLALSTSLEARVRERTTQFRKLTAELALTEERERRVLAQDLHDGLGQILAIVKIKLTSIKESERRGRLKGALREIEGLVDQSNQSVRTLMLQLVPPVLQALGLLPALEWLAEEMGRVYGLSVDIESTGPIALKDPAKTTIFRAVRELLINVSKHAGSNAARICCTSDAERMTIAVSDQGRGFGHDAFAPARAGDSGFGLLSIKDRIEFIGGEMRIETAPGRGTTATIVLPLPGDEASKMSAENGHLKAGT